MQSLMTTAAQKRNRPSFSGSVASAPSSQEVRSLVEAGRFRDAIMRASKFSDLGDHRDRILSAREAYERPAFQRELGKDTDKLIADGIAALRERYGA
jgi:hypothetical protein